MKSPLVSVIIPTHRACWVKGRERDFFRAALKSVLLQCFVDYEIVVVHPRMEKAVMNRIGMKDKRIRYIPSKGDEVGAARNSGLKAARGKWIAFLDSDDLWFPHKLKLQMKFLEEHPEYDMVHSDAILFLRRKNVFGAEKLSDMGKPVRGRLTKEKIHQKGNFILNSCLIMKRDVWRETGSFDESLFVGEDLDFVIRASRKNFSIGYVPQPLVLFRIKRKGADYRFLGKMFKIHLTHIRG